MYTPLDAVLIRAPLLPAAAVWRGARALLRHPLGPQAIAFASPSLAAARPSAARDRAIARYARRAAFRSTPHGLLAGVCLGRLGARTQIATGAPQAHVEPSWAAVDAQARALLDAPEIREATRLRVAPSALRGAATVRWLGPGEPFDVEHEGELDDRLKAILDAADRWIGWGELRAKMGDAPEDADELLLLLVDDGLLQSELAPPLVGPPPAQFLAEKLASLGLNASAEPEGRQAVLVHRPDGVPTLERAAVERAARLVPLLARLQEALSPPAAERHAQPALADALDAVTELYGGGALDLAGFAAGDYGVEPAPGGDAGLPPQPSAPASALGLIVDAVMAAVAQRRIEAALDPDAVAALAPPALPPTAELFLAPAPRPPGQAAGTGWLLGLHAPAGASHGRFAHALGAPLTSALAELAAAERRANPGFEIVDLAFAPSPALADLTAHPKVRGRTLALSRWSDDDDLAPRDLEMVADPGAPEALALRDRTTLTPVAPSPLARVRSTTAPAGTARLLVGWSLWRQHAPWAVTLGPLAELAFVPRLSLEGFVVAPASWRLPATRSRAALARWRRDARVPRHVQVGEGDELLPVDLAAPDAAADLEGHTRVFEIWPPLDAGVDRDGRRIEAVVMVVRPAAPENARAAEAARQAGPVPPPHQAGPAPGWRTFKLFGPPGRRREVLGAAVGAVQAGIGDGELGRWFFLPYVDGPGRREHVRLRVHTIGDPAVFERRLREVLAVPHDRGALTALEVGDYHPERGRFPAAELEAIHALFESDSELACDRAAPAVEEEQVERLCAAAQAMDALAAGLGLDLTARQALATERRRAAEAAANLDEEARRESDAAFRTAGRGLRAALTDPPAPVAAHRARAEAVAALLPPDAPARLLPTLLHLSAVRFLGPDPDGERLAYTFWQRTLEGLGKGRTAK